MRHGSGLFGLITAGLLALAAGSCSTAASAAGGDTLKAIKARGELLCPGHNGSYPPFAEVDDKGNWKGQDIDFCRALTVAIFGSDKNLKIVPLSWAQRFPSLQSGDVDVIIKGTGLTMSRNTELGLSFSTPYFVSPTSIMVRKSLNIIDAKGLDGGTLCVPAGTSTEALAANFFKGHNINVKLVTFEKSEEVSAAFFAGRCDSLVDAAPVLAVAARSSSHPNDYTILPDVITLEPLAAAVRRGDDDWLNLINWMFSSMRLAEDYGITSKNVDEAKAKPTDATIAKLLGATPGIGARVGLSDDWVYNVIKQVGNIGEVYDHNLGDGSPYKIPRGINREWKDGGVFFPWILD